MIKSYIKVIIQAPIQPTYKSTNLINIHILLYKFLMKQYTKINTFTNKPSVEQILSYVFSLAQLLIFYLIIMPNTLQQTAKIILTVLYSISFLISLISTIIISLSDPSDQVMIKMINNKDSKLQNQIIKNSDNYLFCTDCISYVSSNSKHCRKCNRCVSGFDHHCKWINNCIGKNNYRFFWFLIISKQVQISIFIISGSILWAQNNWDNYLGQMIGIWIVMLTMSIFWILILNLILLHIYLTCNNLTTYDWFFRNTQVVPQTNYSKQHQITQQNLEIQKKIQQPKFKCNYQISQIQQIQRNNNMRKSITILQDCQIPQKKQITQVVFENQRPLKKNRTKMEKLTLKKQSVTMEIKTNTPKQSNDGYEYKKIKKTKSFASLLSSVSASRPLQIHCKSIQPDFTL